MVDSDGLNDDKGNDACSFPTPPTNIQIAPLRCAMLCAVVVGAKASLAVLADASIGTEYLAFRKIMCGSWLVARGSWLWLWLVGYPHRRLNLPSRSLAFPCATCCLDSSRLVSSRLVSCCSPLFPSLSFSTRYCTVRPDQLLRSQCHTMLFDFR